MSCSIQASHPIPSRTGVPATEYKQDIGWNQDSGGVIGPPGCTEVSHNSTATETWCWSPRGAGQRTISTTRDDKLQKGSGLVVDPAIGLLIDMNQDGS